MSHDFAFWVQTIALWSVGGHLFSLESMEPMKPLAEGADVIVRSVQIEDACARLVA